ncbi:hypothetical protein CLV62_11313 [Dysgonomonas alginatilytica]|uniref:Tetratricopeptide repeat protein n=1 Tax=Dysgonomonas alginatilytica TaxID=1605892 RepID=A0A2V3PMN1_9BACT|nr:hypothetical protein [Dysgonomonas alginatilytica]PXV63526.1 hypothetical protein CLV62_11313 [Dysgonomonas alginatilytica]
MNYNLEIQKILLDTENIKNPDDRIMLLKQAIHIADANNDMDWGYDLRMDLIRNEQFTAHSRESFPAFAWILNAYDSDPELYSEEEILNEYKWMAAVSYNNLNVSRVQIEAILEDFRKRSVDCGMSSREYYNIMSNWSLFLGSKEDARKYLDLRDKAPEDSMTSLSNDLITTIYVEMFEGDFDKAISHIQEFMAQRSVHQMNPIPVYSGLIYYFGGKMNDPRAAEYFAEADKEFSELANYPFQLYEVTLMMYYMSKFEKEKAWAYFEKYVKWEIGAEDAIRFDFATSTLALFKGGGTRLIEAISSNQPYYREDNSYDLDDLYNHYYDIALNLAQQFDKRNGNTHFNEQLQEVLQQI